MIVIKFVVVSIIFAISDSARILGVFPSPFISHQFVFRPLTQELARRGHEVYIITPNPVFKDKIVPKNIKEIDVNKATYDYVKNFKLAPTGKTDDIYSQADKLFDLIADVFEEQLKTEEVLKLISNESEKFDLLIIEACVRPALVFGHFFKAPVITISSLGSLEMYTEYLGVPTHPILFPNMMHQRLHNLSFLEKVKEIYKHYYVDKMLKNKEARENAMLRRHFGNNVPLLTELKKNIALLMINLHSIWEGNRPVPPSIVYLGGLHLETNSTNKLSQELIRFLDNSANGVVYVSFGTTFKPSELPELIDVILPVFSKLPYDFVLKWDKDHLPRCPRNVKIVEWVAQFELLNHPKVKLFITQGGIQSTDEAIAAGVPVIGIPILGDQWYNTEQYVHFNIGLKLELEYLTEDKILNAITTVIENESYRQNILALRSLIQDQPESSLNRAVWWTEFVIRNKGAYHMQAPGAHISWYQYIELELVLVFSACLVGLFAGGVYLGLYVLRVLNKLL